MKRNQHKISKKCLLHWGHLLYFRNYSIHVVQVKCQKYVFFNFTYPNGHVHYIQANTVPQLKTYIEDE